MNKVSIIYHSETGNTRKMAELVAEGVRKTGCEAMIMAVDGLNVEYIEQSRAVLFGSPTYYGTTSWQMKKLMDTISVNLEGKLGAPFASANWAAPTAAAPNTSRTTRIYIPVSARFIFNLFFLESTVGCLWITDSNASISKNTPRKTTNRIC